MSGVVGSYGACLCDCSEYTGVYVDHLSTQVCDLLYYIMFNVYVSRLI